MIVQAHFQNGMTHSVFAGLLISVTEAPVTSVTTNYFTPENVKVEEGYLKTSFILILAPRRIARPTKTAL
jgi:hypothetical protein